MLFVFNPIIGVINDALANLLNSMGSTSKVILGIVLGGMMAIDMGGPINKAAYVFGTMSIANGNYDIMAAVMVGGMVPPIVFQNRNVSRVLQTMLWAWHSSQRVQFRLRQPIRCT